MKCKDKLKSALVYKKSLNIKVLMVFITLTILSLIYILFFYKWDIREGIADYADKHCELNKECLVSLQAVTPFEWDRAYIFPTGISSNKISKAIGFEYPYVGGAGVSFIFITNNNIVYSKAYSSDPDFYSTKQLSIYFSYNSVPKGLGPKYYYLTSENSKLWINKELITREWRDIFFYNIKSSNENQTEKGNPYKT